MTASQVNAEVAWAMMVIQDGTVQSFGIDETKGRVSGRREGLFSWLTLIEETVRWEQALEAYAKAVMMR